MVDIIRLVVEDAGYEAVESLSGRDCLDRAKTEKPAIILLDIMMPDVDGWRVFQTLKEDPETASIPVIAVTAKSQSIDKMIGMHVLKFDGYVTKPFGRRQLLGMVTKALGGKSPAHSD